MRAFNPPPAPPWFQLVQSRHAPSGFGNIGWNFTKFLVGREGKILKRFDSATEPDSAEVIKAIEAALAAK